MAIITQFGGWKAWVLKGWEAGRQISQFLVTKIPWKTGTFLLFFYFEDLRQAASIAQLINRVCVFGFYPSPLTCCLPRQPC